MSRSNEHKLLTRHFSFLSTIMLDRERNETLNTHLDGMSSDDEVPDHEVTLYKNQLSRTNTFEISYFNEMILTNRIIFSEQINAEANLIFEDVTDEFSDLALILKHFENWRHRDMSSYKDTYFSLCLPKVRFPSCLVIFYDLIQLII